MNPFNPLLVIPAAIVIVLTPFIFNFWGTPFSNSMQDWAHFGTYFAGMLTPLAGFAIFFQLRQQQKEKYKAELLARIESNKAMINRLILQFDDYKSLEEQNTENGNNKPTLESLTRGLVDPINFESVIQAVEPTKTFGGVNMMDGYHLKVIASNMTALVTTLGSLKDLHQIELAYCEFQALDFAFTALGWYPKENSLYLLRKTFNVA